VRGAASLALLPVLGRIVLIGGLAIAGPPEQRYDGPRLSFSVPSGAKVKESPDIVDEHALDVELPGNVHLRLLLSSNKVTDLEAESASATWREAHLRNRGSWGVKKRSQERAEVKHVGSRRFVRMVDQMGSVLGASTQIMLCGSISARLICGMVSAPSDQVVPLEASLVHLLETIVVKRR
jgi:hypothetical protein